MKSSAKRSNSVQPPKSTKVQRLPQTGKTKIVQLDNSHSSIPQQKKLFEYKSSALADNVAFPLHIKHLLQLCNDDYLASNPDDSIKVIQFLVEIFVHHMDKGNIVPTAAAISTLPKDIQSIETKKRKQLTTFIQFLSSILASTSSVCAVFHSHALHALLKLAGSYCKYIPSALIHIDDYNPFLRAIISFCGYRHLSSEEAALFYHTIVSPYDDIRYAFLSIIHKTLIPQLYQASMDALVKFADGHDQLETIFAEPDLTPSDIASKLQSIMRNVTKPIHVDTYLQTVASSNAFSIASFRHNMIRILSLCKFGQITHTYGLVTADVQNQLKKMTNKSKQIALLNTVVVGGLIAQDQLIIRQKTALSNAWLAVLSHLMVVSPLLLTKGAATMVQQHFDNPSIYIDVFLAMESTILPNINRPLQLADFLSAAFSQGGLTAVLALSGLFTLMTKHKLNYPQFFNQLYATCTLDMLYASFNLSFFKLLTMVLNSAYLPLYLVAAFVKKLCYLSTKAPAPATAYITALVFNILRKHPMIAPIINRRSKVERGIVRNAPMSIDDVNALYRPSYVARKAEELAAEQKALEEAHAELQQEDETATAEAGHDHDDSMAQDEESSEDDKAPTNAQPSLFTLVRKAKEEPKKVNIQRLGKKRQEAQFVASLDHKRAQQLLESKTLFLDDDDQQDSDGTIQQQLNADWVNGVDPFDPNALPQESNALSSSLIELKDLINHYYSDISRHSKLFFNDNAPTYGHSHLDALMAQTYDDLIRASISYRRNRLIPTNYLRPLSLLGKSERVVLSEEKYDEDLRRERSKLDDQRNIIESVFTW